ncbi:transcriptional regulator, partial [Lelliottia amnigena]
MRGEGVTCMDAGSRPTRKPKGIRRKYRVAAIFLPGAGIVKGAAMYEPVTW